MVVPDPSSNFHQPTRPDPGPSKGAAIEREIKPNKTIMPTNKPTNILCILSFWKFKGIMSD
jgi:hypothetical protein